MERVHVAIIGGGAIGLAIARACIQRGHRSVIVLEAAAECGTQTSSRSSEVIHAGLYYPKDSLKTNFCIQGREQLVKYLQSRRIAHEICGKLVVANEDQVHLLHALHKNALQNGLTRLELWNQTQAKQAEPEVQCVQAMFSPYSGIFDSHATLQAFEVDILDSSEASIVTNCRVLSGSLSTTHPKPIKILHTNLGDIGCDVLVNAAGLFACQTAASMSFTPRVTIPKPFYSKGNYYKLHGISSHNRPFRHLVYPMPRNGGLGVHSTLDLSGAIRFGPDTDWLTAPAHLSDNPSNPYEFSLNHIPDFNYNVNDHNRQLFYEEIARYWPGINKFDLQADYAGIRPKLCGPSTPSNTSQKSADSKYTMKNALDFMIHNEQDHGVEGLIHLYGIESPGWTSSLALAEHVVDMIPK